VVKTNKKCFECESPNELHEHHVVPRSLGGTKTITLCYICHGKVHDMKFVNHKNLILKGLKNAKRNGIKLGRRKGTSISAQDIIKKHPEIVLNLMDGYSVRNTAKYLNRCVSTIQRVRSKMKELKMI
jgi:hypothetical protein